MAAQQRCIQVIEAFPCATAALALSQSTLFLGGMQGQLAAYSTTSWQVIGAFDEVGLLRDCNTSMLADVYIILDALQHYFNAFVVLHAPVLL